MNAKKLLAALFAIGATFATSAYADDAATAAAPKSGSAKPLVVASAATEMAVSSVNFPRAVVQKQEGTRGRDEVKAEAVEAVRNHKSTMAQHFDLLK
ncbi:hypothetical protein [Pseudoduganella namucuonensis]|uniref:DUF4148 domain-containing protein n=1 Tax=Pseudoduganella namucuonensis TaxID=1035707 RepID=A0A1I7I716_9BURK|nr:hypothetical protein [Pseudoduganella namucuonensis]SFU68700.1 hypothetical protein SAMN05216552_1007146 [Pseudoduganella namucuonensis]